MTLCRRGRSVLVLTLVFGLVTVSIIPAAPPRVAAVTSSLQLLDRSRNRQFGDGNIAMAATRAETGEGAGWVKLRQSADLRANLRADLRTVLRANLRANLIV
jgi:hypothetical protein